MLGTKRRGEHSEAVKEPDIPHRNWPKPRQSEVKITVCLQLPNLIFSNDGFYLHTQLLTPHLDKKETFKHNLDFFFIIRIP